MLKNYLLVFGLFAAVGIGGSALAEKLNNQNIQYKKLCALGNSNACNKLGVKYLWGKDNDSFQTLKLGFEENHSKAFNLLEQGCEGGVVQSCSILGSMYALGWGIDKSIDKAIPLYQQACDKEYSESCFNLAEKYRVGYGVDKDKNKAIALFNQGCEKGYLKSCEAVNKFKSLPSSSLTEMISIEVKSPKSLPSLKLRKVISIEVE